MKKSFFLLPVLLIGSILTGFSGESYNPSMSGNHPILILPDPSDIPDAPRGPIFNPFIAELMDGSDSVLLGAIDNIGTVYVQITSTSGDNYSTYFDTSDGAILLPISGDVGAYTLSISTLNGFRYVGEFTI